MKKLNSLFLIFAIFAFVFLGFALAAPTAPSSLTFQNNATAHYDEGSFTLNWSASTQAVNYTIYIFSNNSFYKTASNNSVTGYSFSNSTQANYTFVVEATNSTGSSTNSTGNVSMYIDSTPPIVSLPNYTNATVTNGSNLVLNISLNDSLSGLTGSKCLVNVNGTNQSISESKGWCNTTLSFSGINDGNHTINIWANDSVGNFGLNNTFYFNLDTTPPSATASCSPASLYEGDTVSCTCSGSDNGSGVASKTADSTPTTNSIGTFSYTCKVTDNAGNSKTSTTQYKVNADPIPTTYSSNNPGKNQNTFAFDKLSPGKITSIKGIDSKTGIKEIIIDTNKTFQNVKITLESYSSVPSGITAKSGKVYSYLSFNTNIGENFGSANFTLGINRSWFSQNGINKNNISLFRYNNKTSKWDIINTKFNGKNSTYYFYSASPNHFSYYAIGENLNPSIINVNSSASNSSTKNNSSSSPPTQTHNSLWWLWVLIALIVIAIVWWFFDKEETRKVSDKKDF